MTRNLMATFSKEGAISRKSGAEKNASDRGHLVARRGSIAPDRERKSGLGAEKEGGGGVAHVIEKMSLEKVKRKRVERTGGEVARGRESARSEDQGTV